MHIQPPFASDVMPYTDSRDIERAIGSAESA